MHEDHEQNKKGNREKQGHDRVDNLVNEAKNKITKYKSTGLVNLPAEELVKIANDLGKHLKDLGLKTTQIRRFLDGVRRIDVQSKKGKEFNSDSIILLKPKLAYEAGRNENIRPLMDVLEPAITAGSKSYKDFKKLVALIEGIIAYHRFHGGKDS